jgi:hypothetical protein
VDFDLSSLDLEADSERGAEYQLRHPQTGMPLPVFIDVYGPDSEAAREAQTKLLRGAMGQVPTEEQAERRAVEATVRIMRGWRGVKWEGETLEFNKENAVRVLAKQKWMRHQIERFHADRSNFFVPSSTDFGPPSDIE